PHVPLAHLRFGLLRPRPPRTPPPVPYTTLFRSQGMAQSRFDAINRGGVLAVRVGQFRPETVRVVVELAAPVDYRVVQTDGRIRVSFPNPGDAFTPWSADAPPIESVASREPAPREPAPREPAPRELSPRATSAQEQSLRPSRAQEPSATSARAATPVVAAPVPPPVREEPRITIYFDNVDIRDVLTTFAEFS